MTDDAAGVYVALGDSISIDDYAGGRGHGGASLLYRNREEDFPDWAGRDLLSQNPGWTFHLLATDGATSGDLLDAQLPRLLRLRLRPSLVTLTIGGNDVLSVYGDNRTARRTVQQVTATVSQTLDILRPQLATPGRLVLGTVYDPSDGSGDTSRLRLPPWPEALGLLAELNDRLRTVAAEHGAAVAEIGEHFRGHGILAGDPTQPDSPTSSARAVALPRHRAERMGRQRRSRSLLGSAPRLKPTAAAAGVLGPTHATSASLRSSVSRTRGYTNCSQVPDSVRLVASPVAGG